MDRISVLAFGACAADEDFRSSLPFRCSGLNRDMIPAALRRRSSQAMQLAFCAASEVCVSAERTAATLPAIFASVAGEIQTTDQLCVELAKVDGLISPSAFHNSVQNTAAGYWSIAGHSMQPASALAAGHETFAMALLEAWCQLAVQGGELLLVCYDEAWPDYLAPDCGRPAFAGALLLAAGNVKGGIATLGKPQLGSNSEFPSEWAAMADRMPVLAAIPLLDRLANGGGACVAPISAISPSWQIEVGFYARSHALRHCH